MHIKALRALSSDARNVESAIWLTQFIKSVALRGRPGYQAGAVEL